MIKKVQMQNKKVTSKGVILSFYLKRGGILVVTFYIIIITIYLMIRYDIFSTIFFKKTV